MGVQGDTGCTGVQGIQGIQGVTGPTGLRGFMGTTGPMGPQGYTGFTGTWGPRGDVGEVGPTGQIGPTGMVGPQGQGLTGMTGCTGCFGPTGPPGPNVWIIHDSASQQDQYGFYGRQGPYGYGQHPIFYDRGPIGINTSIPSSHTVLDVLGCSLFSNIQERIVLAPSIIHHTLTLDYSRGSVFQIQAGDITQHFLVNVVNLPSYTDVNRTCVITLLNSCPETAQYYGNLITLSNNATVGSYRYVPMFNGGPPTGTVGSFSTQQFAIICIGNSPYVLSTVSHYSEQIHPHPHPHPPHHHHHHSEE